MANFMWGMAVGIWLIIGINGILDHDRWRDEVRFAVEECEQELPRNQHCEPVISAKIKEE